MRPDEYARLDAVALAGLVRTGQVRPGELVDLARSAHESTRGSSRAVVELDAAADTTDLAGPLRGVPTLLKDLGATQRGRLQERGSRLFRGTVASGTSVLVRRMQVAGLVVVGRTATSELAIAATVETLLGGTVVNPWDAGRTTSGSSGGAAAAVALGVVPLAHGTDSGGSLRMPASCCGVVGLKPTRGRVSSAPAAPAPGDLTVEFAITKSVRDTAALLDAVHGAAPGDVHHLPPPSGAYAQAAARPPGRLRVAVVVEHPWGRATDPECARAARDAARTCADLGHHVEEVTLHLPAQAWVEAMTDVWSAAVAVEVDGCGDRSDLLEGLTRAWAGRGRAMSAPRLVAAVETLHRVGREVAAQLAAHDVVLTPTLPTLPPRLGIYDPTCEVGADWYFTSEVGNLEAFTSLFNVTGQPAISLPVAVSGGGLPIGVQLAARHCREDVLLALAAQLEEAAPWSGRLAPAHPAAVAGGVSAGVAVRDGRAGVGSGPGPRWPGEQVAGTPGP